MNTGELEIPEQTPQDSYPVWVALKISLEEHGLLLTQAVHPQA